MARSHAAPFVLIALAIAGVLAAAALSGSSEGVPFARSASLDCPPFDIGPPISEEERKYGAEYNQRAADQLMDARASMAAASRAELEVLEVLPTFDETVSRADRVITGTVIDQRLGYLATEPRPQYGLVSWLEGSDARVIHRIAPRCREGGSVILAYWPLTRPLQPGQRYAIVVGPQRTDGTREALLAYHLDGVKIVQFWPTSDSPIGGGSTLEHLVDALNNN